MGTSKKENFEDVKIFDDGEPKSQYYDGRYSMDGVVTFNNNVQKRTPVRELYVKVMNQFYDCKINCNLDTKENRDTLIIRIENEDEKEERLAQEKCNKCKNVSLTLTIIGFIFTMMLFLLTDFDKIPLT